MKRLSDAQFDCLWAIACGSHGSSSHHGTLESLRRRDLICEVREQGERRWFATPAGNDLVESDPRSAP